jgi:peptide/nickel transport system permease protein
VREDYGFNRPLLSQYGSWLGGALRGDLGRSYKTRRPVTEDLKRVIPATVELATASLVLAVLAGMAMGILAALRPGSLLDLGVMSASMLGVSVPVFFLGMVLLVATRGILPGGGMLGFETEFEASRTGILLLDAVLAGRGDVCLEHLAHLVLPAVALATIPMAVIARLTRASMLETLSSDYIRTARAKGLPARRVVLKHALRNALVPIVTALGLQFGSLLAGAVLTESVFSWPGVGRYVVESIAGQDFVALQGAILVISTTFVLVNLAVDMLYARLDPRIAHA